MMKIPNREKMNNRGLTLIEILLSIAIFAIVAVPLLNSFIVGMRVNNKARETQDAQQVAQNVAEAFDATDMNALLNGKVVNGDEVNIGKYKVNIYNTGSVMDADGNLENYELTFQGTIPGDGNETYYVDAVLSADPTDMNVIPTISDIGNKNEKVVRICEEYYKFDTISPYKDATSKKSIFNITCDYDSTGNAYNYVIELVAEYGTEVKNVCKYERKIANDGNGKIDIFLLTSFFNKNASSTDRIEINYNYLDRDTAQSDIPCNVYLISQELVSTKFNPSNIKVSMNGIATPTTSGMKVFHNIADATDATKLATITNTTGKLVETKSFYGLYDLSVTVRTGSHSGNVVASVDTMITR